MADSDPFEIIMAPFDVYRGPVGEAMPDNDEAPAGNWDKIGSNGYRDYSEAGVTVRHQQTLNFHYTLGSTGPRKVKRTRELLVVEFELEDFSLEELTFLLNNETVTDTAAGSGTPGHRSIPLGHGPDVSQHAFLLKGSFSPYSDASNAYTSQYEILVGVFSGNVEPVFGKGEDASKFLAQITVLESETITAANGRFGTLRLQDAVAV